MNDLAVLFSAIPWLSALVARRRQQALCAVLSTVVSIGLVQLCVWGFGERSGHRDLGGFFAAASEGRAHETLAREALEPRMPPMAVGDAPLALSPPVTAAL